MALNGFENLDTYNRSLSAVFNTGLPLATVPYQQITQVVPSSGKGNDYAGLFETPLVREWVGDRIVEEVKGYTYAIDNKLWESTIKLRLVDLEDDEEQAISFTSGKVKAMAQEANNDHPGREIFSTLRSGKTLNAYDGKKFFAANHAKKGGTQSNLDAGGGQAPWYLFDTTKAIKPMILQMRKRPVLRMPKPDDHNIVMRDEALYTTRARYAFGFGLWQCAYRSESDLTEDNFQTALETMGDFEDGHGRPLNITPNLLVVPWSLRTKAKKLLASTVAAGGENINADAVSLLITPFVKE